MLRLFRNTTNSTTYAVGETVLSGVTAAQQQHMVAAGYSVTNVTGEQFATIVRLHGFDPSALPGAYTIDKVENIPLTVQGASEDFITSTMGQVVANTNAVGAQLSNINAQYRDQIKTHVTFEADRVIAAN